ncbi:Dyp-type peroxidase [Streptomyces afghaniensis]|uniref:Dyp-type peroxidase n=1 Tax=Streptomyces afghaniensis TaxID=66865 RepID=UPI0037D010A2
MTSPLPSGETLPQPALNPPASVAVFLVATIDPGGEAVVREVLGSLAGLVRSVGFPSPDGGLGCVAGIGARAWDRLFGGPRPAELHPFRELAGPRHHAPATPGDLFFHIKSARTDLCFALAAELVRRLRGTVTVRDETQAFSYFDSRNVLGFVDGTENPVGRAAADAALVGEEDPGFSGGSYAIVQNYLHDVDAWDALAVEAQEKVIGRTKLTDLELDAPGSHKDVNTVLGPDGSEQKILRSAMPFGRPGPARARVRELLEQVGLPATAADRYPHELSGGQRQRVAIARALAADPDVLFCDEVTSALDAETAVAVMDLLTELRDRRGLALVLVSHDLRLVADRTDELIVMSGGRVAEAGPTRRLLGSPEGLTSPSPAGAE